MTAARLLPLERKMNCQQFTIALNEYDFAAADTPDAKKIVRHVATCPTCAALFAQENRMRELLSNLQGVAAPADFDFKLKARLQGARAPRRAFRLYNPAPNFVSFALAICFVVTAAATLYFSTRPHELESAKNFATQTALPNERETIRATPVAAATDTAAPRDTSNQLAARTQAASQITLQATSNDSEISKQAEVAKSSDLKFTKKVFENRNNRNVIAKSFKSNTSLRVPARVVTGNPDTLNQTPDGASTNSVFGSKASPVFSVEPPPKAAAQTPTSVLDTSSRNASPAAQPVTTKPVEPSSVMRDEKPLSVEPPISNADIAALERRGVTLKRGANDEGEKRFIVLEIKPDSQTANSDLRSGDVIEQVTTDAPGLRVRVLRAGRQFTVTIVAN